MLFNSQVTATTSSVINENVQAIAQAHKQGSSRHELLKT
jgi:hypothetical protein